MGDLIPYERFREKQREKKYGSSEEIGRHLRAKGYPEDFTLGPDEMGYGEEYSHEWIMDLLYPENE